MYETIYHRPSSVDEAAALFSKGKEAKYLAGGHTLIPVMKQRLAAPSDVIDLGKIKELIGIEVSGDTLTIKAATTHYDVATSAAVQKAIPALSYLASLIGDPAVRIAAPSAARSPTTIRPRTIRRRCWRSAPRSRPTSVRYRPMISSRACSRPRSQDGEIITAVSFPIPAKAGYAKFPHPASRFALTGVFVARTKSGDVRVAATGASQSGVMRVPAIEAALKANWAASALDGVTISASGLLSDIHGSSDYRANLIKVMAQRAVTAAG